MRRGCRNFSIKNSFFFLIVAIPLQPLSNKKFLVLVTTTPLQRINKKLSQKKHFHRGYNPSTTIAFHKGLFGKFVSKVLELSPQPILDTLDKEFTSPPVLTTPINMPIQLQPIHPERQPRTKTNSRSS